jgi:hypothetical protein|tara:strand:- start:348 stop:539 length:192 start_codon:yes stop_codon:yes gene_type:complete
MLMVARLSFVVVICGRGIGVTRQRSIAWREGARGPEGGVAIRHLQERASAGSGFAASMGARTD